MKIKKAHLNELYEFLEGNHHYNFELQKKYSTTNISQYDSVEEKVYSLLHSTFNTQSQAKLDSAMHFFKGIARNKNVLQSLQGFCEYIGGYDKTKPYNLYIRGLKNR